MKWLFITFFLGAVHSATACTGKRIDLVPRAHLSTVCLNDLRLEFYLDAALVKEWLAEPLPEEYAKYPEMNTEYDQDASQKLATLQPGDTLRIDGLKSWLLGIILREHIFQLCLTSDTIDLALFDKQNSKMVTRLHAEHRELLTEGGELIKMFYLRDADVPHPKDRDYLMAREMGREARF